MPTSRRDRQSARRLLATRMQNRPSDGRGPGSARGRHVRSRCRCSMCPAIHINSRSWLRSSSTHEPSDPPLRVVFAHTRACVRSADATEATIRSSVRASVSTHQSFTVRSVRHRELGKRSVTSVSRRPQRRRLQPRLRPVTVMSHAFGPRARLRRDKSAHRDSLNLACWQGEKVSSKSSLSFSLA